MSYVRPARKAEVVKWLINNGYDGIEGVDVNVLAAALVEEWDLVGVFSSPV